MIILYKTIVCRIWPFSKIKINNFEGKSNKKRKKKLFILDKAGNTSFNEL